MINHVGLGVVRDTMSEVTESTQISATIDVSKAPPFDEEKALKGWYFFDWANQAYA